MRIKDLATRATKLLTGNAWFVVDNGTKVEKIAYSEAMKQGIEEYAGSTLAGSAQTVKSAIDALNSNTYSLTGGTALAANTNLNTITTPGNYVSASASVSGTLINSPVANMGFSLKVENVNNELAILQRITTRGETVQVYERTATISSGTATWDGEWKLAPTRAEMDAATVKTLTVTATADANGYIDTGLKYNQAVPLCVYGVTINGSAVYPFLYEFLMRGGSPAEKIAVRIKKWNGDVYTGEITFSMKYI